MTRTIYLHVGMPKCATTSVQFFLDHNTDWLAQHGLSYVHHPDDRTEDQGNAAEFASRLIHRQVDKALRLLEYFLDQPGDVILSSEILFGVARGDLFRKVSEYLEQHDARIRVICYLRRQDLWLESDFKQHIKASPEWTGRIGDLLRQRVKHNTLNYNWMMTHWARCAYDNHVTIVPLNKGQAPDYPQRRFVEFIGLGDTPGAVLDLPAKNVSPPTGLMGAARFMKAEALRMKLPADEVAASIEGFFDVAPSLITVPPRRYMLPYKTRSRLLGKYASSNQLLSERLLDGQPLFDPISVDENIPETNVNNEASELLAALALQTAALAPPLPATTTPPPADPSDLPPNPPPPRPERRLRSALGRLFGSKGQS